MAGKSLIMKIENIRLVFNIFDGFQRICIEEGYSLASSSTVFLPSRYSLPALIAATLSMGATEKGSVDIESCFAIDYENILGFANLTTPKWNMIEKHTDKYTEVERIEGESMASYIIKFNKINGRFMPNKVPGEIPKSLFRDLADGKIVVHDGKSYCGEKYSEKPLYLKPIAIIYDSSCLEKAIQRLEELNAFKDDENSFNKGLIFCSEMTIADNLMNVLKSKKCVPEIYLIRDNNTIQYSALYQIQKQMNASNQNYLLPFYSNKRDITCESSINTVSNGDIFNFSKSTGFSLVEQPAENYQENQNSYEGPSIVFLGSACSSPTKYRNVSSILYENDESAVLFDCGEDTIGQIFRLYGSLAVLEKLKMIILSHSHSDHVLGLPLLLKHMKHGIKIIGPAVFKAFLDSHFAREDDSVIHEYIETDHAKILENKYYADEDMNPVVDENIDDYIITKNLDSFKVKICGVIHNKNSVSVQLLDFTTGLKIAFTGDTMPSTLFAKMATGSDVMIHESTFAAEQKGLAAVVKHATESEAHFIFEESKSKKLILTHFTNRNEHTPADGQHASDYYRYVFPEHGK
ncbi:ribonuclease Z [Enteropsectra breve]|nr:ribonuclease Z [Enteropsectra breve]